MFLLSKSVTCFVSTFTLFSFVFCERLLVDLLTSVSLPSQFLFLRSQARIFRINFILECFYILQNSCQDSRDSSHTHSSFSHKVNILHYHGSCVTLWNQVFQVSPIAAVTNSHKFILCPCSFEGQKSKIKVLTSLLSLWRL